MQRLLRKGFLLWVALSGLLGTIIDDLSEAVAENRFTNKVHSLCRIIQAKCRTTEDISQSIVKTALAVTKAREEVILHPKPEELREGLVEKLGRMKDWIATRIETVKGRILPSIEIHDQDDLAARLALEDVAVTIAYLIKHYEEIIHSAASLEDQMTAIVTTGSLDAFLASCPEPRLSPSPVPPIQPLQGTQKSSTCSVL